MLSKEAMIKHLIARLCKIGVMMNFSGIDMTLFTIPDESIKFNTHVLKDACIWLDIVFKNEFKNLKTLYDSQPEKLWNNPLFEKELPEYEVFRFLKKRLRLCMMSNKRPDYFKKGVRKHVFRKPKRCKTVSDEGKNS